jgi:hypothetical protein
MLADSMEYKSDPGSSLNPELLTDRNWNYNLPFAAHG